MTQNILVVDDSKLARMAVAKALKVRHAEWNRIEAANAEEALTAVKSSKIDVALLDFNMPGRDGITLASELRQLDAKLSIAIISANHQQEVVQRARDIGAIFLPKPLTEEALHNFLEGTDAAAAR
jgi:CheY-like chemotaxis protein